MKKQPDFWLNFADVFVLWSLAVAQPLYSLLASQPEFFVARGAGFWAIAGFVVTLSLLLPLLLFGLEVALSAGRVSKVPHFLIVAGLTGLLLYPPLKRAFQLGSLRYFAAALLVGIILSALYLNFRRRALSMVVLLPVVLIFPLIFLLSPSIRSLLRSDEELASFPKVSADAPVVLVVFDEFPVVSLMKENQELDVGRYPNFAALAREATWYRNASAVAESTAHALPAILDGCYPDPDARRPATAVGHPDSLFTLLGGSYRFNVIENTTRVCPDKLRTRLPVRGNRITSWFSDLTVLYLHIVAPTRISSRLPDVSHSWKDYGAVVPLSDSDDPKYVFEEFLKRIEPSDSTLNFVHIRLPHFPWSYLPDGKRCCKPEMTVRGTVGTNDVGEDPSRWADDNWAVTQGYQRHLLQVGMADWLIGRLVARLKEQGIYDESLIVITADHGTSFRLGDSRRALTSGNYVDIIAVPLFIKKPYQTAGAVDDRNVEAVDILPTITDILKIQLPWKVDGVSALGKAPDRPIKQVIPDYRGRQVFDGRLKAKADAVRRQVELFGSGDWRGVFRIGLPPQMVEKRASEFAVSSTLPIEYEIAEEPFFQDFDPDADRVRTLISGELARPLPSHFVPAKLVISANDRIVAFTESYRDGDKERFAAMTSDSDFVRGPNLVEVFVLSGTPETPVLERLRKRAEPPYQLGTKLSFGRDGNGVRYLARGWSFPEKNVRWNDGPEAEIVLPMAKPQGVVLLQADVAGFLRAGKVARQQVRILIDGEKVGEWSLRHSDFREESLILQPEVFKKQDRLVLRFEAPDAVSPLAIGVAKDVRRLGFALRSLTLSDGKGLGVYKWGDKLRFGVGGNCAPYRRSGWSAPEEGINWNDGTQAEVQLPLPAPKGLVVLEIFAKPFVVPGKVNQQRLRILINGQVAGEKILTRPDFQDIVFEIPAGLVTGGLALVTLETPDAAAPQQIGTSADQRRLAIAVRTLCFRLK
jgi:hypothetical protein